MFDSIISSVNEKYGLGDKAGSLVSALVGLMTDSKSGGFRGFIDRFHAAGLGDLADSWISSGANTPISGEQLESALGEDALRGISEKIGANYADTVGASGYVIPHVVDDLTPDGEMPNNDDLLARTGGYVTGAGTASGAVAQAFDRVDASQTTAANLAEDSALAGVPGLLGEGNDSPLAWLFPLLTLGLLVVLGFWFCGSKSEPVALVNTSVNKANTNASATDSNANSTVKTTNSNAATESASPTERTLTEVSLPGGAKLSAYPNGIEDQLIRFIESNEYKNGTNDTLKDRWFSFDDLNFKFGTTELAPESKRQLDNIVAILKAFPAAKIKIGGYTDKKGDDAANRKLSGDRAAAVKSALEKSGVGAQVPEAEGYGEEYAVVPETASDEERKADRKTSVRLLK